MPRRGSSPNETSLQGLLSIGALSAATGIPVDTIRTWERRYGFPTPERKLSGQRVYELGMVPRLRRVAQAIASGHRAAQVLLASERDLEALLAALPLVPARARDVRGAVSSPERESARSADALRAVRSFDAERLKREFQMDWARLGPIEFLEQRAAAFLTAVGTAWAEGQLEVRHEHFASAVLGDFFRTVRSPLDDRASGPLAALATLPGELHGLGLQMAALVFAVAGWRTLVLGVDTPVDQIAALAREAPLAAVALSCVQPRNRNSAVSVRALRRRLPQHIPIIIGGGEVPAVGRQSGIEIMPSLAALDRWLQSRRPG